MFTATYILRPTYIFRKFEILPNKMHMKSYSICIWKILRLKTQNGSLKSIRLGCRCFFNFGKWKKVFQILFFRIVKGKFSLRISPIVHSVVYSSFSVNHAFWSYRSCSSYPCIMIKNKFLVIWPSKSYRINIIGIGKRKRNSENKITRRVMQCKSVSRWKIIVL